MTYYAHTLPNRPKEEWELVEHHLNAVAEQTGKFAEEFGAKCLKKFREK